MKPPRCHFCLAPLKQAAAGGDGVDGLVQFADFVALPEGMCGHPPGLEWFCSTHFAAARRLSGLTTEQAMRAMQPQKGVFKWTSRLRMFRLPFGSR